MPKTAWLRHFLRHWPFVGGIHWSPVNSPHKGQWHGALMFSLICAWINSWVNNCEAGDLKCHRAHYDITVIWVPFLDEGIILPVQEILLWIGQSYVCLTSILRVTPQVSFFLCSAKRPQSLAIMPARQVWNDFNMITNLLIANNV